MARPLEQLGTLYGDVTMEKVRVEPFWKEIKEYVPSCRPLFDATSRWLQEETA